MYSRRRPLSEQKTLGTGYNLRPATQRATAQTLRVGHVVMESADYPAFITHVNRRARGRGAFTVILRARYVWSASHEPDWLLGEFRPDHPFDRALTGEY